MIRFLAVFALLLLSLGFAMQSSTASAHCLVGEATTLNVPGGTMPQYQFDTSGDADIPVYLVAPNATVIGQNSTLVGRAIGRAVDAINRYSYAGSRLRYGGIVASPPSATSSGIYILQDVCTACGGAIACTDPPVPKANPSHVQYIITRMTYNPAVCPAVNWQFYPDFVATDDIQAVVTHELGHALGLAHSGANGNCPTKVSDATSDGTMAISSASAADQRHLSRDDAQGLIALYSTKFGELDYHTSTDGITWGDGNLLNDQYVVSVPAGASSALEGESKIWFLYRAFAGGWVPRARGLQNSSLGPEIALSNTAELWDPPAAAFGNGVLMVAALGAETTSDRSKNLQWHRTANLGVTWTIVNATTDGGPAVQTMRDGVSIAYEPQTMRFVAAYTGDGNYANSNLQQCVDAGGLFCDQVRIATIDSSGANPNHTPLFSASGGPIRTAVAPTLACGPASIGANNCLLAWTSTTSNSCIYWGHGDVDGAGEFVLSNQLSISCYAGFSPAYLMFKNSAPLDPKPFRMALSQEGVGQNGTIFTLRKSADPAQNWSDLSSIFVAPWRHLGGYGALQNGADQTTRVIYLRHAD